MASGRKKILIKKETGKIFSKNILFDKNYGQKSYFLKRPCEKTAPKNKK